MEILLISYSLLSLVFEENRYPSTALRVTTFTLAYLNLQTLNFRVKARVSCVWEHLREKLGGPTDNFDRLSIFYKC